MSRRVLPNVRGDIVWVGWDPPMGTYFAQIYVKDEPVDDTETPHDQIGYAFGEVGTVKDLAAWLERRGYRMPEPLADLLEQDREVSLQRR